jgi:hypothetical protein
VTPLPGIAVLRDGGFLILGKVIERLVDLRSTRRAVEIVGSESWLCVLQFARAPQITDPKVGRRVGAARSCHRYPRVGETYGVTR